METVAGLPVPDITSDGDVNGDENANIEDVLYIMRALSFGPTGASSLMGPLANADVEVFSLSDLSDPIFTTTTDENGAFVSRFMGLSPDSLLLVRVSGGTDLDPDADGTPDDPGAESSGSVHALMTVGDFNAGSARTSLLTEISYQYTRNLFGDAPNDEILEWLQILAGIFLTQDIDGSGVLDYLDFIAFDLANPDHQGRLAFPFDLLTQADGDSYSLVGACRQGREDDLRGLLEDYFGDEVGLFVQRDPEDDRVEVTLATAGAGRVTSTVAGLLYDSSIKTLAKCLQKAYVPREAEAVATLRLRQPRIRKSCPGRAAKRFLRTSPPAPLTWGRITPFRWHSVRNRHPLRRASSSWTFPRPWSLPTRTRACSP